MRGTYITLLFLTITYLVVATADADPSDRTDDGRAAGRASEGHAHDYSRFSDGPRRVPTPRGASKRRAERLGLGDRRAASVLRHHGPEPRWVEAAPGRRPDRLLWPVDDGRYVRGYGYVRRTRPDLIHNGVDISAPLGTVVRAAADGIVAYSDNGIRGFGNCVLIVHPNGWVTMYAHLARATVQPGWRARRGERIGLVGSTGNSRGPPLHFELRRAGRAGDPGARFDGGPAYVRRVAARIARAGRVPPPRPVTAQDRRDPGPLRPWSEEAARGRSARARAARAPGGASGLGSTALLARLLRRAPSEELRARVAGELFSDLLWPVRGGRMVRGGSRLRIAAERGAGVRAAADGLVVFAGRSPGRGRTVALLDRRGWVTLYGSLDRIGVRAGQQVRRGQWVGRVGHSGPGRQDRLDFEVRIGGRAVAPLELLRGVPDDAE
ncbi:MAG: murein hydrolase activator EnvC family protein [Sandaracinaceae bacterium]